MNPFTKGVVNPLTKGVVIASTLAAAFAQLYLATRLVYPQLFFIVLAAFAVMVAAGSRLRGPATAVVLAASYLAPAAYVIWAGFENYAFEIVWSLPLLGLLVSGRDAWRWHLPAQWRWPLVSWALVVAASWPWVFLREVDFRIGILPMPGVANTSIGITPWDAVTAVTYWTLVHNIGLLWFDRLFSWYTDRRDEFRSMVLAPLGMALAVASAVGAYQAFVDLRFVNPHLWPHMGRASGTLGDANTFGMIAALWGPAAVVLARRLRAPWSIVAAAAGVGIAMLGVLTSGSRTALIVITLSFAAIAFESAMAWRRADAASRPSLTRLLPVLGGVFVLAFVVLLVARGSLITSVIDRGSLSYVPFIGDRGIGSSIRDLFWDRYGYGPPAIEMVKEHPVAGTGVGSFHTLVHDFAKATSGLKLDPDNAQSWYRHNLAELGILGSIPWLAWCVLFGAVLLSRAGAGADRYSAGVLRGTLLAFGFVSLMAMPGQSMPVALTFWTLAFWFVLSKGVPAVTPLAWPSPAWTVTLALVVLHAAVTFADARGDLRPRHRSVRFGWDYRYGISNPEVSPDGSPGRRWTELRSLSMVPVKGKVLKFVAWVDHPDADERPVHTRVWVDRRLVYDDGLKRSAAIFLDLTPAPGQTHMMIETEISRMWNPTDFGRRDRRILGLSVRDWTWE